MTTVWVVDERSTNLAGDLAASLRDVSLLGVHLLLQPTQASAFGIMNVKPGDVVVVHQKPTLSTLPALAPAWLQPDTYLLPIIDDAKDAAALPDYLKSKNALLRVKGARNFTSILTDEIVTRAALGRQTRSVFISYQRRATLGVARELAGELQSAGFTTFLDEQSILPSADIDAEIAYRLNDVDLVILLSTATLDLSTWVHKEITFAANALIGVLVIDCDGSSHGPSRPALFGILTNEQIYPLSCTVQHAESPLSKDDRDIILGLLRDQRLACVARRVANLLPAALERMQREHPAPATIEPGPRLGELRVSGQAECTRVFPFRPTAEALWEARQANQQGKIRVVHPENVPRDERVRALRWLSLPVEIEVELQDVQRLWL